MFSIESKGSFTKTETFLKRMIGSQIFSVLDKYGAQGVAALSDVTPIDTSNTAHSWTYEIKRGSGTYSLEFRNTSMAGSTPVVVLLTYGHGTRNGGYVEGRDFINPAIQPIFDKMAEDIWKEVTK